MHNRLETSGDLLPDAQLLSDPKINASILDRPDGDISADTRVSRGEDQNLIDMNFYGERDASKAPADMQAEPMSPGKKLLYYAGSPARFVKKQVRPGSVNSSMFSLIIICLGAGTITIPYTFQ